MKHLLLLFLCALLLAGSCTPDHTGGQSGTCEVHDVAMSKRTVPIAYGMIPMSRVEAEHGEWKRRTDHYPHPGDCLPATDINLKGNERAIVYVCPKCEAAKKEMERAARPDLPRSRGRA